MIGLHSQVHMSQKGMGFITLRCCLLPRDTGEVTRVHDLYGELTAALNFALSVGMAVLGSSRCLAIICCKGWIAAFSSASAGGPSGAASAACDNIRFFHNSSKHLSSNERLMAVMRERGLHAALNIHLLPVMASMYVTTSEIMHCKSGSIWQTCKGSPVCV